MKKGEKTKNILLEILGDVTTKRGKPTKKKITSSIRKYEKGKVKMDLMTAVEVKRKPRSDKGSIVISGRDTYLLTWINEQMGVSSDHLRILLARTAENKDQLADPTQVSLPQANRMIARWREAGLINVEKVNNRVWVWVTNKAIQNLDLEYGFYEPTLFNHMWSVNKIRLYFESRGMKWTPERELRRKFGGGEAKWKKHYPDGEIEYKGNQVAIEVELSHKKTKDRGRIISNYGELLSYKDPKTGKNNGLFGYHYGGVYYFVNDKTEGVMKEAVKKYESIIRVINLNAISETAEVKPQEN